MKIEATVNEPVHLFTAGPVKVHARALPMADALDWCKTAAPAYMAMGEATPETIAESMQALADCLRLYPAITSGLKEPVPDDTFDSLSAIQVREAVESLLEMNDPLAEPRRIAEAKAARDQEAGLKMLSTLPPEEMARVLSQTISAQSASNSTATLGKFSSDGRGRNTGQQ